MLSVIKELTRRRPIYTQPMFVKIIKFFFFSTRVSGGRGQERAQEGADGATVSHGKNP